VRPALLLLLAACSGDIDSEHSDVADPFVGILLQPEDITLPVGEQVQLRATGLRADRTTVDLTPAVEWRAADPNVVGISNSLDAEGLATGVGLGQTKVYATFEGVTSSDAPVRVTDIELTGLGVSPTSVDLAPGDTLQLTATARFSDGSTSDASGQVRWKVLDPDIAVVEHGLVEARAEGETRVAVIWNEHTAGPVDINVAGGGAPDLTISGATAGGDPMSVYATVENLGSKGASEFWVDVFIDPASPPVAGDIGDTWADVAYLGAGETVDLEIPIESASASDIWVLVSAVNDSQPGNDAFQVDLGGEAKPDLMVLDSAFLVDDSYALFVVEVANLGNADADTFFVDLFEDRATMPAVDDLSDHWEEVAGLGSWESVEVEFLIEPSCTFCTSWIAVDTVLTVDESDEDNNVHGPYDVSLELDGWDTGESTW